MSMTVWERHEKRQRRQEELARIDRWLQEHPWQAWFISWGLAISIIEVCEFLRLGLEAFARWVK